MITQALIRRNDATLSVDFTEAAIELKARALEAAALVGKVRDAASNETAVQAQQTLVTLDALAEKARVECKEPVLTYGRKIDEAAKAYRRELKEEILRISMLTGDFQELEKARVRAEQQAENERLSALEREKFAALAQVKTHDERDAVQAEFNQRAVQEAPAVPPAPIRAAGQRVSDDWDVSVTDIWLLAKAHPTCVKIEPLMGEIKTLLKAGVKVSGVNAKPIVKSGVTRSRTPSAIDV